MTDASSSDRASYREARSAFEKLDMQDKVAFVVEATFTTLGNAVEGVGRGLSDLFEDLSQDAERAFGGRTGEQPPSDPAGGDKSAASDERQPGGGEGL